MLPEDDELFLAEQGYQYSAKQGAQGEVLLIIPNFDLPPAYTPRKAELLIRLLPGYPRTPPDMFWTRPDVRLASNGAFPQAADVHETYDGLAWQRWSRHSDANQWRPMIDGVHSFLRGIKSELSRSY
jgi:hypothetical protein